MDINTVKSQIIHNKIERFYVFTGEEVEVLNCYVKKIAEVSGKTLRYADCVADCFKTKGMSLLKQSYCYVVRDDKDFMKSEKALNNLDTLIGSNILILVLSNVDKRGKFYKQFVDKIVEFKYLDERVLLSYLADDFATADAKELINACGGDYGRLLTEWDKVKQYSAATESSMSDSLHRLIDNDIIYSPPQDVAFDWIDAVLDGKPRKSFRLLEECLELGEAPLRLLSLLYNNVKWLLQVQACESTSISKATGLADWQIKKAQGRCGVYRNYELVNALKKIREVERGIKSGDIEEQTAIPYVLISIFS